MTLKWLSIMKLTVRLTLWYIFYNLILVLQKIYLSLFYIQRLWYLKLHLTLNQFEKYILAIYVPITIDNTKKGMLSWPLQV